MWKTISFSLIRQSVKLSTRNKLNSSIFRRHFLSHAYYCNEVWEHRLKAPLFQKVNLDELYNDLEQSYQKTKNVSAVDVDVFANAVQDEEHFNELRDVVYKLRLSADASNILPSTSHALIRLGLKLNKTEELLRIIDDRLNYGVFLDDFDANILMDSYIKAKNYAAAAHVAAQLMLQENFEHSLARSFAALSCYLYLKNPTGWIAEPEPDPEPEEEVKVRVKYLRNPSFDDHFDLRDPLQIVGKTLHLLSCNKNDTLNLTIHLVGLVHHGKRDEAKKLIENLKASKKSVFKEANQLIPDTDEEIKSLVQQVAKEDGNLQEILEKEVTIAENAQSEQDVAVQCQAYSNWEKLKMDALKAQMERLDRAKRIQDVDKIQQELVDKERKLWFFEKEDNIELQIDANKVYYRKKWFGKKKKPRKVDEGYVPPEIR